MRILGIETSCDETAAAVVEDGRHLLSNEVVSSMDLHALFGGIVPEIAARSHIEVINPVIEKALKTADCNWHDIDGIAVTYGAGLNGSLLIGVLTARTLALVKNKPLYAINHMEGHLYANFITSTSLSNYLLPDNTPKFPMLGLIVSGGHTQLVFFKDHKNYQLLGQTTDDAIGEAFDKVAKILGLPYPGGPSVSRLAEKGDPNAYKLPIAKTQKEFDFSFSGLKTAVLRLAQHEIGESYDFPSKLLSERLNESQKANIAASFQRVAIDTVVKKTLAANNRFNPKSIVIGGGVASDSLLRSRLSEELPHGFITTDRKLCTDNGAMIATLGFYQSKFSKPSNPYTLGTFPNLSM